MKRIIDESLPQLRKLWDGNKSFRTAVCMAFAMAAAVLLFLLRKYPPEEFSFWPPCIFHKLTGLYCPGCGNTRALYALLHFDLRQSLSCNVLLIPSLVLLAAITVSKRLRHSAALGYSVATTYILFTLFRNLPWHPFTLLAP